MSYCSWYIALIICPGQINPYQHMILQTKLFLFFLFLNQITNQLPFVYLLRKYKVMKWTALQFTGFN